MATPPVEPTSGCKPDSLRAKVEAGADLVQTRYRFEPALFARRLAALADHGLADHLRFIVGIGPLASAKSARWMNTNLVGVHVPGPLIARLEGADDQRAEGCVIRVELMQQYAQMKGAASVHPMAPKQEEACARAIADSGLLALRR